MVKIPSQRIILIPLNARQALKRDTNIRLKKADKGSATVALKSKCCQKSNIFKILWQQLKNQFRSYSDVR